MYTPIELFIFGTVCLTIGMVCGFFIGYMRRSVSFTEYRIPDTEAETTEPPQSKYRFDPKSRRQVRR